MVGMPSTAYTVRRPTSDVLGAVLAFMIEVTTAEFGEPDYSEGELRDEWSNLDLTADDWLVEAAGGDLLGYTTVRHRAHVRLDADGYVHPWHEGRGVGTLLVRLTEGRAMEHVRLAPPDARVVLNNGINGRNERARRLLEGEGYALERHFWRMSLTLDVAPPPADRPAGITLRVATPEDDLRRLHQTVEAAFADHWGHVPASFETWAGRHAGSNHDRSLWFLAVDGEEVAGIAICRHDQGIGWIDRLGVVPARRRQGTGQALLRQALGEFFHRGYRGAALGVDAANETGATRLYESAGMRADRQYAVYQKELRRFDKA